MSSLADQESAVQDFIETLEAHQRNCERLGRFVEAEIARKRLEELKLHEESRRRETLRARQLAEVLAVEEAHMMEFQQFNHLQDAKMGAFEMNAQALMDALRARHTEELRDYQQRLLSKDNQCRHSKEYYTLRDVQEKLAHGKNYAGAAKIKEKADELMAWEEEKHSNERQVDLLRREKLFKERLATEAEALRKRVAQGRAEASRTRQRDLERVLQRYNNVKGEVETRHRAERAKLDKEIALEQKKGALPPKREAAPERQRAAQPQRRAGGAMSATNAAVTALVTSSRGFGGGAGSPGLAHLHRASAMSMQDFEGGGGAGFRR
jgi:hypothetical protein